MSEVEQAETFLKAEKIAVGKADWVEGDRSSVRQIAWPLAVGGAITAGRLLAYSPIFLTPQQFGVVLAFERCIARIDYEPKGIHRNPFFGPRHLRGVVVRGPHAHLWEDNQHIVKQGQLPAELPFARKLPKECSSFEHSLAWFCRTHHIALELQEVPELPWEPQLL